MPTNSSLPYPIPSLFTSPSLSWRLSPKGTQPGFDFAMSPTSTLETKHFSSNSTSDKNQKKKKNPPIGLALVDVLHNESNNGNKSFLVGPQLKVQVPSPRSPIEFGAKNRDSQLALPAPLSSCVSPPPPRFSPQLLADMELSEEYTCVISHGPNPKTTHIFDTCIVESCGGGSVFIAFDKEKGLSYSADDFLRFCDGCKRSLSQGRDIFMYRGERAFCSEECRQREMLLEEERDKFSQDVADLL